MTEPRFTKGPWEVAEYDEDAFGWKVTDTGPTQDHDGDEASEYIATVYSPGNAAAVAALPDLYEALKNITDCYGVGSSPDDFCKNVLPFMVEGRAALAKARGEAV